MVDDPKWVQDKIRPWNNRCGAAAHGWQTLAVDGAVFVTMPVFVGYDHTTAVYVDLGIFTLGAPIVHIANGEVGRGLGSLVLRASTAALGVLAYRNIFSSPNCDRTTNAPEACGFDELQASGLGLLATLAMGGVVAIDAAVLARHDVPVKKRAHVGIQHIPNLQIRHDLAMITMGGTF